MRGEYAGAMAQKRIDWELPPRARRILVGDVIGEGKYGTTSACAENTVTRLTSVVVTGNYLRVRGEYISL